MELKHGPGVISSKKKTGVNQATKQINAVEVRCHFPATPFDDTMAARPKPKLVETRQNNRPLWMAMPRNLSCVLRLASCVNTSTSWALSVSRIQDTDVPGGGAPSRPLVILIIRPTHVLLLYADLLASAYPHLWSIFIL